MEFLPIQRKFGNASIDIIKRSKTALGSQRNLTFAERKGSIAAEQTDLTRAKSGFQVQNQLQGDTINALSLGSFKLQPRGKIIKGAIVSRKLALTNHNNNTGQPLNLVQIHVGKKPQGKVESESHKIKRAPDSHANLESENIN